MQSYKFSSGQKPQWNSWGVVGGHNLNQSSQRLPPRKARHVQMHNHYQYGNAGANHWDMNHNHAYHHHHHWDPNGFDANNNPVTGSSKSRNIAPPLKAVTPPEDKMKRRNLHVSPQLVKHFKPKPVVRIIDRPYVSGTDSHGRRPTNKDKVVPIRHSGYKSIIEYQENMQEDNSSRDSRKLYGESPFKRTEPVLDFDAPNKIRQMRSKILAGEFVSMTDIAALRVKMGRYRFYEMEDDDGDETVRRLTTSRRMVLHKMPLYCDKGIVKIPMPHTPRPLKNTFGTPGDLRISLSNSNTPEFEGRRRFHFDLVGVDDNEIKLFLEGSNRLIIKAERLEGTEEKPSFKITEFVDLPRDLPVDNLRIVRDVFGTLIVEEAWKFA